MKTKTLTTPKSASYKSIIKKSLPAIFSGMLTSMIPFVDNFASGLIGDTAIGVVSFVSYITMIFTMFLSGIFTVFGIMIGQYNGKNDIDKINQLHRLKILFTIVISGIGAFLLIALPDQMLRIFTSNQNLIDEGRLYVQLYGVVTILAGFAAVFSTSLANLGITVVALFASIISIIINTTLDITLITAANMDVEGLAIATIAVEFSLLLFYIGYCYFKKITSLYFSFARFFYFEKEPFIKSWKNWQNLILQLSYSFAILVTTIFMARAYDKTQLEPGAIMGILTPFTSLLFTGVFGFFPAIYYFVSPELSKNNFEVAKENARRILVISIIITIIFSIIISSSAYGLVRIFTNASQDSKDQSFWALTFYIAVMPAFAIGWLTYTIVAAGGQAKSTTIFDFVFLWVIYLGVILIVFYAWRPYDFWLAWIIGQTTWYLRAWVGYALYKQGLWITNLADGDAKKMVGFAYWLQVVLTLGIYHLIKKKKTRK